MPELERALEEGRIGLAASLARVASLEGENQALRARLDAPPPPVPSVGTWLERRGLTERDERRRGLAGLALAGDLDELLGEWPAPPWAIEHRLCLTCGRPGCETPVDMVSVSVPAGRCELCAGHTAQRLFRRVDDACLLTGHVRILWCGGPEPILRWVRERLDRRIQTRMYASTERCTPERWAEDLRWASVVVAWAIPVGLSLQTRGPVIVEHRGPVGQVLVELAARVDSLPSSPPPRGAAGDAEG